MRNYMRNYINYIELDLTPFLILDEKKYFGLMKRWNPFM